VIAVLFGTYNSAHAANVLLAGDLERGGIEVRACHEPLWEETRDKHDSYFAPRALLHLGLRWLRAASRLARAYRRDGERADLLVVGFNGQLDLLLARLLRRRRAVLFAPLVTVTETLIDDRGTYRPGSMVARLLAALDRVCLRLADLVVIDTAAHRDYLCDRLGTPHERVLVQYLGAEEAFASCPAGVAPSVDEPATVSPAAPSRARPVQVLFYCTYVPLHGARVVAEALRTLSPEDGIEVTLIGSGPERAACEALVRSLPWVRMEDWVAYVGLPARIRRADVVLGIFGASVKARMVIPNKVYQAAQVGRAIVTADTPAIREVFRPGESIWAIAPEPEALASALRELARDAALRARLGDAARADVAAAAGPAVRAERLRTAVTSMVERTRSPAP
jgi:glycosyltransferase involved in cell wall biosynthesis